MRRYLLRGGIILAAIFICCDKSNAQGPIFELTCPVGTTSLQALQTTNTVTFKIRQNYCVDASGNVFENISGSGTLGNINSIRWVDGVKFPTCDSAINDLQSLNPAIAPSPNGASESGSTITITTSSPHGLQINQTVFLSGIGVAGYNGNAVVATIPTNTTFTAINWPNTGLANSGGGTVGLGGVVEIPSNYTGINCSVFTNQDGYLESRTPENITLMDNRASDVAENINFGGGTFGSFSRFNVWQRKVSPILTTSAILGTNQIEGLFPINNTQAGITGEVDSQNSITYQAGSFFVGIEGFVGLHATTASGTLATAYGLHGSVNINRALAKDTVALGAGVHGGTCTNTSTSGATFQDCYAVFADLVPGGTATRNNYSIFSNGSSLWGENNGIDITDGNGVGKKFIRFGNDSAEPSGINFYSPITSAGGNPGEAMRFRNTSGTHTDWMIGAQVNVNNQFEITPSTVAGGTTFSNPAIALQQNGNGGNILVFGNTSGSTTIQTQAVASGITLLAAGTSATAIPASLTTTAATSDNVTITGMTASGHCILQPTNASADTLLTGTFVSAKAANQITVTHAATAGATFDILCTPN